MPFIADDEVVPQGRFIPDEEPAVPDLTRQPRAATAPVPSPFNYFTGGGFERTRQQIGEFGKLPLAEKKETALTPTVQFPKFTVQPDDSFIAGLAKESANQLIGLPEFATSPVGIATAGVGPVAGKIGQTAIRVGFLADTIYNFLKQAPSDIDAYIKASPGEKGAMIARWAGTGALAGTLASPEIKRAGDAIKKAAPILPRAAAAAEEAIAEAEQPAAPAAEPEGGPSASEIRSTAQVPEHEVRPQVGEETPLRQQGEPAATGEAQAQAPEVAPAESPPPSTGPPTEAAASTETPTTTPQPSEKAGAALPVEKPAETKVPESGRVSYRVPATGKVKRFIKWNNQWFQDKGGVTSGKALDPNLTLTMALDKQLAKEVSQKAEAPASAAPPAAPAAKEPWQMTAKEYLSAPLYDVTDTRGFGTPGGGPTGNIASVTTGLTKAEAIQMADRWNKEAREKYGQSNPVKITASKEKGTAEGHRRIVSDAAALGKPVPAKVLAEYGLKPPAAKPPEMMTNAELVQWYGGLSSKAKQRVLDSSIGPRLGPVLDRAAAAAKEPPVEVPVSKPETTHEQEIPTGISQGKPQGSRTDVAGSVSTSEVGGVQAGKTPIRKNYIEMQREREAALAEQAKRVEAEESARLLKQEKDAQPVVDVLRQVTGERNPATGIATDRGGNVWSEAVDGKFTQEQLNAARSWLIRNGTTDTRLLRAIEGASPKPPAPKPAEERAEQPQLQRTSPRTGTPERQAIEDEYDRLYAPVQSLYDQIAKLEIEKERTTQFTKKWETLSKRISKLRDQRDELNNSPELKKLREQLRNSRQEDRLESVNPITVARMKSDMGDREIYNKTKGEFVSEAKRQGFNDEQANQMFLDEWGYTIEDPLTMPELVKRRGEMVRADDSARSAQREIESIPELTDSERRHATALAENERYRPQNIAKELESLRQKSAERVAAKNRAASDAAEADKQAKIDLAERINSQPEATWDAFAEGESKLQYAQLRLAKEAFEKLKTEDKSRAKIYRTVRDRKPKWFIWLKREDALKWADDRLKSEPKPTIPAGPGAKTETQTKAAPTDWTSATAEPTEFYSGIPVPKFPNRRMSELDKATTRHSGKLQKSFDEARRAQREINKEVPTERRQNSISIWREAGGDIPTLQAWAAAARGKLFKQAAIDAQNLTPKELAIANRAIAAFRVLEARGNRFDVLQSHRDNYIPHIWDVKKPGTGFGTGMLKQRFRFSKARTFNTFFEGDQAGFTPKTLAIGKLLPAYLHEMNLVIADRQFVADVVRGKASDGRELAVPKGNAVVVDNPSGKAVLVKPQASRVTDTQDYRVMPDQPALTKWTWEGKDTDGKPIFVKAELGLHPEAYKRIKAVIGQSELRSWYHEPVSGFGQIPRAVMRGLDYAQGAMKREMFGLLAPFHQVQEGTHAIGHVVNPFFNIPKIDMRRPDMMDAANHGLMLLPDRASSRVYLEGVGTQTSLISRGIRKLGPAGKAISDVIDGYQDYLFHHYIPGLKFKTYEALLSRNMKLYADELTAGTMTPADVKLTSAEQANAAYGHLNYGLLDRSPTLQHLIQMGALAPDFLEARGRFAGQAVEGLTSKVGHEQLKAIAILAAAQAGTAIILSNLLGVPYDPKHPFELIYKGRRYSMRSVPEDIYNLLKDTRLFIYSRVNPLTVRGGIQALTGLNYRGEKVTPLETFEELLAGYIPLTARSLPGIRSLTETSRQNPVSPLQQLAGSLGLRISRYSPISETYKKAGEWMDAQKIDRSKGSYPVSKYQQLRYALEDGDMAKAKAEYDALRKTMTYSKIASGFQQSINHPFTDSPAHDRQFAASLKGYDRQLYDQAIRTRKQILNAFLAVPSYR